MAAVLFILPACNTQDENFRYLGQTPPGQEPRILRIPVAANSFAAERIAISPDNKNIFFQELDGYPELDGKPHTQRVKYFTYKDGNWQGPFVLFEGWGSPALTLTGDTMYIQKGGSLFESYLSVKQGDKWSFPKRIMKNLNRAHYLQVTANGSYYAASIPAEKTGVIDRCVIKCTAYDTAAISLGSPINYPGLNLDFFIQRDESFIILPDSSNVLCISYHNTDGSWTNPRSFGKKISFGLAAWGPYVTPDNKYLFYTTGIKPDYSDTYIYWVRIDHLIDSLKNIK